MTNATRRGIRGAARGGLGLAVASVMTGVSFFAASGTAVAAGNGYGGGTPVLPAAGIPGGFRKVLTAFTVGPSGRAMSHVLQHVRDDLSLTPGSTPRGEQVVLTAPDLHAVTPSDYRALPASQRHDHPLYGLGVVFQRNGTAVQNRKFATLRLIDRSFSRSDYVAVYSPARGGFVPAPKGHARCQRGMVVVRFRAGTEVLVLARSS